MALVRRPTTRMLLIGSVVAAVAWCAGVSVYGALVLVFGAYILVLGVLTTRTRTPNGRRRWWSAAGMVCAGAFYSFLGIGMMAGRGLRSGGVLSWSWVPFVAVVLYLHVRAFRAGDLVRTEGTGPAS